jgi:acyl-CoA reductase-like NAD-dependent aldehyde dehydrogenase
MPITATRPRQIRHLIGGAWTGEPSEERRNPADLDEVVSMTARGGAAEVDAAVGAAAVAQSGWAATAPPARGVILDAASRLLAARAEETARDLVREEGKTLAEARGEVARAIDILRFYGGEGWRLYGQTIPSMTPNTMVYTRREPVGVVGVITPWNFPIAIPAWKIAPALIAGNAVVHKPASLTSVSAHHLASALVEAGLPAGVLNVVYGSGREVGDPLVEDRRVAALTFTGSTAVGRGIHAKMAARMARVQLEKGGKNPLVVLDDADVERAAQIAAQGGFGLTGQACTATSRVIATPGIAERFIDAMKLQVDRYRPGNGLDEGVLMGPVISEAQLETDRSYLAIARDEGGEVVFGGEVVDGLRLAPAVVAGVRPEHRIATEEVFGPVIAVIEASDFDEALAIANAVPYGLTAGICTTDLARAHAFAERVQAGVVKVNRPTAGVELNVPFGGIKQSSTGTYREQGQVATEFFTWSKSVYLGWDPEARNRTLRSGSER